MDFYKGGELHFHHRKNKRFTEPRTLLYVAEIVLALEYLHSRGVMFRDLKVFLFLFLFYFILFIYFYFYFIILLFFILFFQLENIMLDANGHLRLIDFGLAKDNRKRTFTLCGTPE